jgi:hypothetical protein
MRDVMTAICRALDDSSTRVAGKACYALHNLTLAYYTLPPDASPDSPETSTQLLSLHYIDVVKMLLKCAARSDAEEPEEYRRVGVDLRTAGFEALCALVESIPASDQTDAANLEA